MSWSPIGIGGSGASGYRTGYPSVGRTGVPNRPIGGMTVNVQPSSSDRLSLDEAREQIRAATDAFRGAFGAFTTGTKAVSTTTIVTNPASTATIGGSSARVNSLGGAYSVLQTTTAVNTQQTSTDPSSSAALGLDLTSAISRLDSGVLGLDLTSPEAASTLTSSAGLGLDLTERASTIGSTAEMNTATTSYSKNTLAVTGPGPASTSKGTLSGAYTGTGVAANATSLVFKTMGATVTMSATIASLAQFEVRDQNNTLLFSFNGLVKAGQQVYLGDAIGLSISFSAGSLTFNQTDSTAVSKTTPTNVNADVAFNNSDPNLRPRFENNAQVTAGSFTINDTSITVNAGDTINTVLARINASSAGVTASLANDKIALTTNSASESNIVLANDTSGFLAATKLSGATTTQGNIRDDQQALSGTARFGGVTSGSFTINGKSISINKDTDSLTSVISKINSSGAGVTASYDEAHDKVLLTTTSNSEDQITVTGDTTGFLSAAGLSTNNTVRGNIRDDQQVLAKTTQFAGVASGSFTINGVSISVNKDTDSLSSIVSRINGTGAGVTANFNASTNKIELATTSASENLIAVGNDTTGFVAATGLSSANTIRGSIADDGQALSSTAAFAGVTSGSFTINGVAIAVDPGQDSLNTLIARINTSGAGVTASYDSSTDKVKFTSNVAGANLAIENDTSGFLAAAKIATGVTGTYFDPDAAFNATGSNAPAFDDGRRVQAGSFTVNGTTITVAADDTVNKVLAKINGSAAGVTATYDDMTETVRLTRTQASADSIVVGNDASGFVGAVKLDRAQSTTGSRATSAFDATLGEMAEYSGVQAGTITVNGQQIAIDPATTTIRGLVSSLNSVPGLVATLDETSGAIRVSSTTANDAITISDTSGVLSKLGILSGTYNASAESTSVVETPTKVTTSNASKVVEGVAAAVEQLNKALSQLGLGDKESPFRDELTTEVEDAFDVLRQAGVEGFDVRTDDPAKLELSVDRDRLARSLNKLGEHANARTRIDEALEGFSAHMAKVGDAPASEGSQNGQPVFGSTNYVWARLTADQAATALLYMKSTLQPVKSDVTAAKAAERYAATSDAATRSDRPDRFELTNQLQDALAAAQVTVPMTPAPPPPAEPAKPAVPKIGKADSGSRGLTDRNRSTSPFGGVNETAEKRDRRDEDTFEYRGSDRHVRGTRTRRGARRGLRDTLRTIGGRQR